MNLTEQYNECVLENKSEESALKLSLLQKDALAAADLETYLKATLLLEETLVFLSLYDRAIQVLQDVFKTNVLDDFKIIVNLTDKLVGLLLKTEDFKALENVLIYRERFIVDNPSQILMQKFYLSVCYEGLKKYQDAVTVLRSINDNISNNNLVSKYLKLAMLELRLKNLHGAREAFEYAAIFDKSLKNEMFYLVESDLLFAENDFAGALKKYQEFFLKTKTKNRYLDRYIYINVALGNFEDAWKFFGEYSPKMASLISKNYRYQFFEAGVYLAESMKKMEEAAEIKEKMLEIYDEKPIILDAFDGIRHLMEASEKKIVFAKTRDVVLETFRDLFEIIEISALFFVQPLYGEVLVYQYQKGLLMEKKVRNVELESTILGKILGDSRDYSLFTAEELNKYEKFPPIADLAMLSVQSFKVTLDSSKSAFIVAFLDQEYHFDYINKLLFTTKSILNLKLSHFLRLKAIREESNAFERLFTTEERGLAKIIEGTVFLSNAKAHDLLETDMEMLPYEILQSRFQTEKTIYLDRLISKTVWTLPLSTFKEKIRQMEIRVFVDEFTTYLSFKDITEESHKNEDLKLKSEKTAIYDLKNMHRFRADFQDLKAQTALFCMKIANISALEKKYLHSDVETLNRLCHSSFKVAAGSHVLDCYLDENGFFLAIFLTVDKRIIDRIFNEFTRRFHEVCPSVMPSFDLPDIRGSVINVVKNRSLEQNLDQLYKVIYRTTKDIPLLYFDKNMSLLESQNEAVNFQLDAMLAVDNPILEYRQVGNLETRKVEMYRGWLADNILPFPSEMVLAAACSTRKSVQLEMMIFRQSIKDVLAFCQVTDVEVGFIISFGDETLQEPQRIDEIVRLAKRTKVPPHKMVILYRPSGDEVDALSVHNLRFLKEKGFRIGLENVLNLLKFGQKDCLEGMDFLFIQADELLASSHSLFLFLEEAGVGKIVASGVNEEEKTKASLQLKIPRIEGNVLPNRFKIEELIKKLEKH